MQFGQIYFGFSQQFWRVYLERVHFTGRAGVPGFIWEGTFLEGISWEGIIREGYFGILNGCPSSKKLFQTSCQLLFTSLDS